MKLEEAKKLYLDYGGSMMAIGRDDPEKYRLLMKTSSEEDRKRWTDEILDGCFEKLEQAGLQAGLQSGLKSGEKSNCFSRITDLLRSSSRPGTYLSRLIGVFPLLKRTETFWKIVILETVAGRTAPLKDGLIAVCAETCPSLSADLVRAVRDFMVFPVTVFDAPEGRSLTPLPERYADALKRTKRAIAAFTKETE